MQALPPALPMSIPATDVMAGRLTKCDNGNEVPPQNECDETLDELLTEMQQYLHCVLNAHEISQYPGSCGVLRAVKGTVEIVGLSVLIDECLSCLEPAKICPGKEGDVLTTVGGKAVWAPPSGGAPGAVDCAAIMPLLEKDGCIEAGAGQKYSLGYDASSDKLQYFPYSSTGFITSCADLKSKVETCFTKQAGPATHLLGIDSAGKADFYPVPSGGGGAQFIADCAGLKDKLGTCISEGTSAPTKVLAKGANGIEWLNPPAGGGSGAIDCADLNAKLVSCPPKAADGEEVDSFLGYTKDGATAKIFKLIDPAMVEVRAAGDPPSPATGGNAGGAKIQTMNNTTGFQDVTGLWGGGTVHESGGTSGWFNAGTGRIKIGRKGRYQISYSLFIRAIATGGAALQGNIYAGVTIIRAAGTYNGVPYRKDQAIFRGNQAQIFGNNLQWDYVMSGSLTYVLAEGDEVFCRVAYNNTSPGISLTSFLLRDDGAAHLTLAQLPDSIVNDPN
jgi:hypothetical protein